MSQPGFSGNRYLLDINGDGGAFVAVLAKSPLRRLVVRESTVTAEGAANTLQGLIQYRIPNDGTAAGFTTVFQEAGANDTTSQGEVKAAQIELGSPNSAVGPWGELIGNGPNVICGIGPTPATHLIDLRSGTATGTTVEITEYN